MLHKCARIPELPSNINTMVYTIYSISRAPPPKKKMTTHCSPLVHGTYIRWWLRTRCAHMELISNFDWSQAFGYIVRASKKTCFTSYMRNMFWAHMLYISTMLWFHQYIDHFYKVFVWVFSISYWTSVEHQYVCIICVLNPWYLFLMVT